MRGRVPFTVGERELALRFTTNRLCDLEENTGISVLQFVKKMENPELITFSDVRRLMQAGLEGEVSLNEAGEIADEIGVNVAIALIAKAFGAAFEAGKPAQAGAPGKTKRATA